MAVAGSQGVLVESDALLAARENRNLIGKPIVVKEMPKRPRVLCHAGKRREHVACFARLCFAASVLMLVINMGVLQESVNELVRPVHWSEVMRLGVIPLHGGALAMISLAHRRRVMHHGGRWLRGGRASYRAWREIDVSFTLIFATSCFFALDSGFGEAGEPRSFMSMFTVVCAAATFTWFFIVLRAKLARRGMSSRAWLRRVW
jgi:hypothetical protein